MKGQIQSACSEIKMSLKTTWKFICAAFFYKKGKWGLLIVYSAASKYRVYTDELYTEDLGDSQATRHDRVHDFKSTKRTKSLLFSFANSF